MFSGSHLKPAKAERISICFCFLLIFALVSLSACTSNARAPVTSSASRNRVEARASTSSQSRGYHVVQKGDTLYSIAWRYGKDFKEVAAWNGINPPYVIYPEQKLRLTPGPGAERNRGQISQKDTSRPAETKQPATVTKKPLTPVASQGAPDWHWPASGRLVKLNLPTSEKGLNISGSIGQEIKAAATGEVVYSGSGLLGYGKLIIIKHNENYLSAYAHNDRILIKEGMKVTTGQKIATMGIGNNGEPLLHFEIRKDGRPVDPLKYLPDKRS